MIEQLLALLALSAWAFAVSLTHPALARRRLKKSSIYLCRKRPDGRDGRHANSAVSANRSADAACGVVFPHAVIAPSVRGTRA